MKNFLFSKNALDVFICGKIIRFFSGSTTDWLLNQNFSKEEVKYSILQFLIIKQENERFILQKVWYKIKLSIKSNNFQSLNFILRSKRRVKVTNCPSVLSSDLEVRKNVTLIIKHLKCFLHFKFLTDLSIFGHSEGYSNEFLLKIETGLSLECDMSLFFSEGHKCLKYLTKTCESDKPKYIFRLTVFSLIIWVRNKVFTRNFNVINDHSLWIQI
jgi:hypothetical protein